MKEEKKILNKEVYYWVKYEDPHNYVQPDGSSKVQKYFKKHTQSQEEFEGWLQKGKIPVKGVEGHGVWTGPGKTQMRKIVDAWKETRVEVQLIKPVMDDEGLDKISLYEDKNLKEGWKEIVREDLSGNFERNYKKKLVSVLYEDGYFEFGTKVLRKVVEEAKLTGDWEKDIENLENKLDEM